MNVQFHYKIDKTDDIDSYIAQQIQKVEKRLQVFKPDMVSLHGTISENPKKGVVVGLNLRLPSGQMAAREAADSPQSALKAAFDDLIEQLTKHKDHLRAQHKWPRPRRTGRTRPVPQVPFEETLASLPTTGATVDDVREYINANMGRLTRFVNREIRFRRQNGEAHLNDVSPNEVVDEAIMYALDDRKERPEKFALEAWLYRMARQALGRISSQERPERGEIALDATQAHPESASDDDSGVQFGATEVAFTNENVMADSRVATPEEITANDEIVTMILDSLRGSAAEDREAFILATFEGFTVREISGITDRTEDEIRAGIERARSAVSKNMRVSDPLKDEIMNRRIA